MQGEYGMRMPDMYGMIAVIDAAVAGVAIYKSTHKKDLPNMTGSHYTREPPCLSIAVQLLF